MKNVCLTLLATLAFAACGGSDADAPAEDAAAGGTAAAGTVRIVSPTEGEVVNGPTVMIQLESSVPIVPAGEMTPGTGHHHLYLDTDLTDPTIPIPTIEGSVVHMGDASSAFTFEFDEVSYGPHTVIAVVADGAHVPLQPWVVDTVTFTVRAPQ